MKGAIVFATEQGLGRQAKQFHDHGIFDVALIWPHSHYKNHPEWYPNQVRTFDELLDKCDTIIFFETPFDWSYVLRAHERGVKTIMFAMYECTQMIYVPNVIVGGSILEAETWPHLPVQVITVPVPDELKWRQRTRARVFVHNAGHGGLMGRNGTRELLEAMQYVKSPIKLIIRTQIINFESNDPRVEIRRGDFPYETLFDEGDVFIYPDKFGGSCLPLQESHASGMMVMASDRHPSNTWLPKEPLIPIVGYKPERIWKDFASAIVDPKAIATAIDVWYNKDITKFSLAGKKWGEENSWKKLKPKYEAL
jgi:hypothetical protein